MQSLLDSTIIFDDSFSLRLADRREPHSTALHLLNFHCDVVWCSFYSKNLTAPSDMRDLGHGTSRFSPMLLLLTPSVRLSSFFSAVCPVFLSSFCVIT